MFTDTFAGIAPSSSMGYIAAQILGGAIGLVAVRAFFPTLRVASAEGRLTVSQEA